MAKEKKPDKSPLVFHGEKVNFNLDILERPDLTEKQKELTKLILDKKTKIVFISGPAGVSKTFCAVYAGLKLLQEKRVYRMIYARTIAESASKSIGMLPGDIKDKLSPFVMPLMDKLEELLPKSQVNKLLNEDFIRGVPVNFLRGASYSNQFIILEEFQNFNISEAITAITRLGEFSKMVILFDPLQSDINGQSAAIPFFKLFSCERSKENGIHTFEFTKEDIVRSEILKFIIEKMEELPTDTKNRKN